MRLTLLVTVLLLAGCAAPDAEPTTPTPAVGSDREPILTNIPVSLPAATPVGEPAESAQGTFEVPEGANETLVEARWTCTSPICGFSLVVYDSDGDEEKGADGDGDASITLSLTPGTYTAALVSSGPAANMEGEIRASVFFGAIPSGHSAFEG